MNKLLFVPLLAALVAAPAWASAAAPGAPELTPVPQREGFKDLVEVHSERSPIAVIARDALYGGLAGLAIGGGVALISGDNVGRDLAIGAGVGLIAGAIFGAVDAASADRYMAVADSTAHDRDARSQNVRSGSLGYGVKF
jgi:hypothetical protein